MVDSAGDKFFILFHKKSFYPHKQRKIAIFGVRKRRINDGKY